LRFGKQRTKPSALHENQVFKAPDSVSSTVVKNIQHFENTTPDDLTKGILILLLSRAITLVESTNVEHLAKSK
jgi:LAO/AO transport system kinase